MKKIITLVTAIVAWAGAYNVSAGTWKATTIKEFQQYWQQMGGHKTAADCDTILVVPAKEDMTMGGTYNAKVGDAHPITGKVVVIGVPNENGVKPILQFGCEFNNTDGLSLIFENLDLQYRGGTTASSGQIFYWDKKVGNVDSIIFRNCDINNLCRSLYRSVPPDNSKAGICNYFEMSNCTVHNGFVSASHNWPVIYFGQAPIEVVIKNNTFYDMPNLRDILQISYIDLEQTGAEQCTISFYNNTVLVASNNGDDGSGSRTCDVIDVGNYLALGSTVNMYNNLILYPDWRDELNVATVAKPRLVAGTDFILNAKYNVIEGYQPFSAGEDTKNGEGFLSADTTENFTMADAELAWDDFFDREKKSFLLAQSEKVYTLGKVVDEEGGYVLTDEPTCIGDPNLYRTRLIKAAINVNVTGSRTAKVTIMPKKEVYLVDDEITVIADTHNQHNKFLGWSDGETEIAHKITLTGDLNLTATFEEDPYALLWDTFKDFTSQTLELPVESDHMDDGLTAGSYSQKVWRGESYVDTASCQSRVLNNKTEKDTVYNRTVSYPVALCRTALDSAKVEECEKAESFTSVTENARPLTPAECGGEHPAYHLISFSTKGLTGVTIYTKHLFEARSYKKTNVEWSTNGTDFNLLASFEIDSVAAGIWVHNEVTLPTEAEGLDMVYVRWIGDPTQPIVGPGMDGTDKSATPQSRKYHTYHFIADIMVCANETGGKPVFERAPDPEPEPDEPDAIENVEADVLAIAQSGNTVTLTNVDAATVELYNTVGARVASVPVIDGTAAVTLPAHGAYIVKAGKAGCIVVY